ncbi:MAG: hypothetical protein ACYC6M_10085, partial [Terriglobales bacterium]
LQFTYDYDSPTSGALLANQSDVVSPATPNQIRQVNILLSLRSLRPARRTHEFFSGTLTTAVTVRNLAYKNRYD